MPPLFDLHGVDVFALTKGLPVIPPETVDLCRLMMVRYSVIYRVTR
jgi:hypothetical protein